MKSLINLSFWTNGESGNSLTHKNGLTVEQVAELQKLKPGDRLILFTNKKRDRDTSPHFNLKTFGDVAKRSDTDGI